jgi:glycerophosphoryl diester phosphodiesterase
MISCTLPLIAHRGESHDAPENTMGAINLAWERGALAVEIDIHLTIDNEICVIHDSNTRRTTGAKFSVRKSKIAQLQQLDAGLWKGKECAGERIPTLSEVLITVPPNGKLIIEIKSDKSILEKLREVTKNSGLRHDQIEIIAFNLKTLAQAKKMMPDYRMLWLIDSLPVIFQYLLGWYPKNLIKKVKKYNLDGINIGDGKNLTANFIKKLKQAKILVYTWTVNDPERAKKLFGFGVDFITTDRSEWMLERLRIIM